MKVRIDDHDPSLEVDHRLDQVPETPGRETTKLVERNPFFVCHSSHGEAP
jgi:hypothetical protein